MPKPSKHKTQKKMNPPSGGWLLAETSERLEPTPLPHLSTPPHGPPETRLLGSSRAQIQGVRHLEALLRIGLSPGHCITTPCQQKQETRGAGEIIHTP